MNSDGELTIDEETSAQYISSYNFRKSNQEKAKLLSKHILAMLKVGKENAIDKETILINLQHFCPHNFLDDYIISDALGLLYGTTMKQNTFRGQYYLRESKEEKDGDWY